MEKELRKIVDRMSRNITKMGDLTNELSEDMDTLKDKLEEKEEE